MGKFFADKVAGYYLYFTSHDDSEPVHSHASESPKCVEAGSAKIWVYKDGSTKIAKKGTVSDSDLKKICAFIKKNHIHMFKAWEKHFGAFEVYGEPDILHIVRNSEIHTQQEE